MKVVVIGARGIGQHHAKWFALEGCEVVAFAGRRRELLESTRRELVDLFGFAGRAYAQAEHMLQQERPDVAVVASPHTSHLEHLRLGLDAGAHVYLEKPFHWDKSRMASEQIGEARALIDFAQRQGKLIGFNTQYVCGWAAYEEFVGGENWRPRATRMRMEIESRNQGRYRSCEDVWIDLAPHPLSMVLNLVPDGALVESTARVQLQGFGATAKFTFASTNRSLEVFFRCASVDDDRVPRRRFGVDDVLVDCSGRTDERGIFRAVLCRGARRQEFPDFMHESIRHFIRAVRANDARGLATPGALGLRNLELHHQLSGLASREGE